MASALISIHIPCSSSQRNGSSKPGTQCRVGIPWNPRVLQGRLITNDAWHLAAARVAGEAEFVSADIRQRVAADLLEFTVVPAVSPAALSQFEGSFRAARPPAPEPAGPSFIELRPIPGSTHHRLRETPIHSGLLAAKLKLQSGSTVESQVHRAIGSGPGYPAAACARNQRLSALQRRRTGLTNPTPLPRQKEQP
jgi:hypothetical protein